MLFKSLFSSLISRNNWRPGRFYWFQLNLQDNQLLKVLKSSSIRHSVIVLHPADISFVPHARVITFCDSCSILLNVLKVHYIDFKN